MKLPSLSSKKFAKILKKHGCYIARQGATDHAIFVRKTGERKFAAPVQMGKKSLSPLYVKLVFRQLGFEKMEIKRIFRR